MAMIIGLDLATHVFRFTVSMQSEKWCCEDGCVGLM
jgi:hypothetical protein